MNLTPRTTPLSKREALHLLRRTTFHPTWQAMQALEGKTPAEAVALVMAADPPIPLPSWAGDQPVGSNADAVRLWYELQQWWIGHCLTQPSFRERLVAMWHNHFTSDYITVYWAQWMVQQSQLLRTHRYKIRDIGENIVGDPAMLIYLNGNQSVKGNPNENFGREWFELFTLGIGNYTEHDIIEASRAFTGWRVTGLNASYSKQLADLGEKTILGQTGNWEYKDVVRITLEQDACARFFAAKILRTFVEYYPSDETIDQVAQLIKDNAYNLEPVFNAIFCSEGFYEASIHGALIKDPMALVLGVASVTGMQQVDPVYAVGVMSGLTMTPFYPPTVQGWTGHHAWINSSTFPQRQRFAEAFIDGRQTASSVQLKTASGTIIQPDLVALARQFPDNNNAHSVVSAMALLLLPVATSAEQEAVLLDIMMAGADPKYWDIESGTAVSRLKLLTQAIVRMPEFQLN
ncbi:MAG: DUF1800 domain-containing protein [Bradyrhizobiaceae bacterium]|nr:DUF1800 domain-containing protein [Bradyrhizobiaceae bacterium]